MAFPACIMKVIKIRTILISRKATWRSRSGSGSDDAGLEFDVERWELLENNFKTILTLTDHETFSSLCPASFHSAGFRSATGQSMGCGNACQSEHGEG